MNSIPFKTNSLTIDTAELRLLINDDEKRVVSFNPEDIEFVSAFYDLIADFSEKEKEFAAREAELKENTGLDALGIPTYTKELLVLNKEIFAYLRQKIDDIFGDGTSKAAFGKANTLNMFEQFFNGIVPFVQAKRTEKLGKYQAAPSNVMKA